MDPDRIHLHQKAALFLHENSRHIEWARQQLRIKPMNDKLDVDRRYHALSIAECQDMEEVLRNALADYSYHFVRTGERPCNFITDASIKNRYEDVPDVKAAIDKQKQRVKSTNIEPMRITEDPRQVNFKCVLPDCRFDIIYIETPMHEPGFSWDSIRNLPIRQLLSSWRGFVFLWCGDGEDLEEGRRCLAAWDLIRFEDVTWIKSNHLGQATLSDGKRPFRSVKEHCLVGRKECHIRDENFDFVMPNMYTDVIVSEEPEPGKGVKPSEIYLIMESFCLGRRRLQLFGQGAHVRRGWLTVGKHTTMTVFDLKAYRDFFVDENGRPETLIRVG